MKKSTASATFQSPELLIDKVKTVAFAESNCLYLNPPLYKQFVEANSGKEPVFGMLNDYVFILKPDNNTPQGSIGVPAVIRTSLKLSPTLDKPVIVWYDLPKQLFMLGTLKLGVTCPTLKPDQSVTVDELVFIKYFRNAFKGHFIGTGQEFYHQMDVNNFNCRVLITFSRLLNMILLMRKLSFILECALKKQALNSSQSVLLSKSNLQA